ncbi:hypothetical protein D3C79_677990 [compost metagenome]
MLVKVLHQLQGILHLAHGGILGHLQHQAGGGNMVIHQGLGHQFQQVTLIHAGGDVDAHLQINQPQMLPLMQLLAGGIQDPAAELLRQLELLRDLNHFVWWNEAQLGMTPAQQCFDCLAAARLQVDDGLVIQLERVVLQRHHHVGGEMLAPDRLVEQGIVIDDIGHMGLATVGQGLLRPAEQLLGLVAVHGEEGDADAHLQPERVVIDENVLLEGVQHAGHQLPDMAQIAPFPLQHGQLIAPETSHPLAIFTQGPQSLRQLPQQQIPGVVAKLAVDVTKVIDVDQHQPEWCITADIGLHLLQQRQPVGEAGQGIDPGHSEVTPGLADQQTTEQDDGDHQAGHHK